MAKNAPDGGEGSDQAVAEVVEKELALLRPEVRVDRCKVVGLLHEGFQEFGASGRTWDRSAIADALVNEAGDVDAEAEDMRAVRLDQHVILLTYRARRQNRVSLRSSIWVHSVAGWQLLFHQGTPCL